MGRVMDGTLREAWLHILETWRIGGGMVIRILVDLAL